MKCIFASNVVKKLCTLREMTTYIFLLKLNKFQLIKMNKKVLISVNCLKVNSNNQVTLTQFVTFTFGI